MSFAKKNKGYKHNIEIE